MYNIVTFKIFALSNRLPQVLSEARVIKVYHFLLPSSMTSGSFSFKRAVIKEPLTWDGVVPIMFTRIGRVLVYIYIYIYFLDIVRLFSTYFPFACLSLSKGFWPLGRCRRCRLSLRFSNFRAAFRRKKINFRRTVWLQQPRIVSQLLNEFRRRVCMGWSEYSVGT